MRGARLREGTNMVSPCPYSIRGSVASVYVATLKAAPQAEALEQENRALFLHEDWRFVSVYSL